MRYALHDDISFCRMEGGLVFLDIQKDRYFRLSRELEKAFLDCIDGEEILATSIDGLLERNILTLPNASTERTSPPAVDVPHSSLYESFPPERKLRVTGLLEVSALVCSMQARLRLRPLKETLTSLAAYRRRRAHAYPSALTQPSIELLRNTAYIFRLARPYIPIKPNCLLDSLALAKFLARRNLYADVVFGVTSDPFSAHCWLQTGTVVVNDSVGNVDTYIPIRVIR